jgi:D-lactate dehydratase / protein deglycase
MFKKIFGIAPQLESDGSYKPSKVALKLAVQAKTDYEKIVYEKYQGQKTKILVIFTEKKDMTMKNGKKFSTGNHPVEAILPMLHLKEAGFEFVISTPSGKPVVFEMWAMPSEDQNVLSFYEEYKEQFEKPQSLNDFVQNSLQNDSEYSAVFIPGGHGVMLGIPEDVNVGNVLRWAHEKNLYTITLCHGPGALLSTKLESGDFIYAGYEMVVFPDSVDQKTPIVGYLPGHMPWKLCEKLLELGVNIKNKKSDNSTCVDRKLITGASPMAANELGKLSVKTLLEKN